ncbi:hypothetical protein [Dapis sp. BLCC M229]|uniref:hypothetical protein n=1 Tax=Dapis sp. BLCC M229 TaxID=3400188 RepID=UPI003CEC9DF7
MKKTTIIPLENGDTADATLRVSCRAAKRLTIDEFEKRYFSMQKHKKAELEKIVYMTSPLRFYADEQPHFQINTCLGVYAARTPGVKGADNTTIH